MQTQATKLPINVAIIALFQYKILNVATILKYLNNYET